MTVTALDPDETGTEPRKRSKLKLVLVLVAVLAVLGGVAKFVVLAPEGEPKPGEVVALEATQVNLAEGHYLRIGIALQLVEGGHEVDGSKALDAAIEVFSGLPVADVLRPGRREQLREQLMELLEERYHGDVMEVYFTEFVTQ